MVSSDSVKNYNTHETSDSSSSSKKANSDSKTYFRNLDLSYFVGSPMEILTKHSKLLEACLKVDNPEAHYIEGVLQYFVEKKRRVGLYHLRQASILNNTNGTFLYGILMLALGRYDKGKKYLDKLQWKESLSTSDQCWERVSSSLNSIPKIFDTSYHTNMVNFHPKSNCSKYDYMFEVCNDCYHFKRLFQFVDFAVEHDN